MPLHAVRGPAPDVTGGSIHVARIVEIVDGQATVTFDGHAVVARSACAGPPQDDAGWIGRAVLVVLEGGDPALPVIVGLVSDKLPMAPAQQRPATMLEAERLVLAGEQEVTLRCGEASVTLRADGQVFVKGTRITSRAAEAHKIRGATVDIN